jgi:hypothetical protein
LNTNTDARLLDTADAIESLGIVRESSPRKLAPTLAPNSGQTGQKKSIPDHSTDGQDDAHETQKACQTKGLKGFSIKSG